MAFHDVIFASVGRGAYESCIFIAMTFSFKACTQIPNLWFFCRLSVMPPRITLKSPCGSFVLGVNLHQPPQRKNLCQPKNLVSSSNASCPYVKRNRGWFEEFGSIFFRTHCDYAPDSRRINESNCFYHGHTNA